MTITVLPAADHVDDHDGRRVERLGSVGRAQTGIEIAVLDDNDKPLPSGELGEVCVRGDVVMAGYLNNPEATAQTLANGWLHTGDRRPLRRARLSNAGRPQQGFDHLRWLEHLSTRGRGGSATASCNQGGRGTGRAR